MDIQVTDPVKKGDGMSAYMAYKVVTSVSNEVIKPIFTAFFLLTDCLAAIQEERNGSISEI